MITVIVKYKVMKGYTQEEILGMLKSGAEKMFKGMPHLHSKQFCFDFAKNEGLSVYLWDSRQSAEAFFTEDFLKNFDVPVMTSPTVEYYDNIVTVDNRAGDVMTGT